MEVALSGATLTQPAVTRTCVGCRQRSTASQLLRVIADVTCPVRPPTPILVRPDPRRRAPGRGAWIHPDLKCVALAERRRAFGRALRIAAPTDSMPVRDYVTSLLHSA